MKSLHNKWMLLPLSLWLLLIFSFCSKNDALASNEDNGNDVNNGSINGKYSWHIFQELIMCLTERMV